MGSRTGKRRVKENYWGDRLIKEWIEERRSRVDSLGPGLKREGLDEIVWIRDWGKRGQSRL